MSKQNKPPRNDHPYYGRRYSVPVLCWDSEGVLNVNLVCWDYSSDGWVFANLHDGPDSWNYEIECEVWALPPEMPNTQMTRESDPTGRVAGEAGAKLDAGKNRMGLVCFGFANALREVCKVGTYGAGKYSANGWRSVPEGEARYTDAMLRHLFSEASGNETDEESDLLHAAQVAWNALARLELQLQRRVSSKG